MADLPGKSIWCQRDEHDDCGGAPGCECSCHEEKLGKAVSHSRVEAYLQCQRKEFYSYGRKLRARTPGLALNLGTNLHAALEVLYSTVLAAGANKTAQRAAYPAAVDAMWEFVENLYSSGWEDDDRRAGVREILENYLKREPFIDREWADDKTPYQILAVEREFNFEYDPENGGSYPFVVDLIVFDPQGRMVIVDHKGLYDFYSTDDVMLKPQIPKYIASLRALGYKVHRGMYNMLRTRPAPKKSVRKAWEWTDSLDVDATPARVERTMTEQVIIANHLEDLDRLSPEDREQLAVRSAAGTDTCKRMCDFRDLCVAELRGDQTALLLKTQYETKPKRAHIEVSDEV